ncbi:hypothetical protein E4S40_15445 [Algoriphagus kandeliae]|uniref:histidine kinase n=1 Tax=Algoriphagus kandeliae TaxID=2562278 RepID=A0A4Y9QRD0_9BACT|nr:ATP-binding protein [Algoriphagus kandeliae]TFV93636.1 hypothetical protein E4S40_15445 [Algoriphagus kandeliae]
MTKAKIKYKEAQKVYERFWDSYLQFDEDAFAATLDDHFEMIGTSETEICHSKAEGIAFLKAQKDELGGKAEMRNRQINPIWIDPHVLINETCDIYVNTDEKWNFYASIRISTILRETPAGWKVAQQHGSFPDMRVDEGQTLAIKKISKENQELREAVKRRTVELETKNRELEIEASLERVRTVAMGMKKPEDMLDVCRILADQLQGFGIENIRNVQTAIINEEKGHYLCYQYFPPYQETTVELTEYLKSPVEYEMVQQMLASKDGHFIGSIQEEKLKEFAAHRKEENHFSDPILDQTSELSYCFLSIGEGGLGLSLYNELKQEVLDLFKRFHQVFSLAYRRFLDIQQAEAQAREAQIEASLERVRAHAMGLRQSDELEDIIAVIFEELQKLGLAAWECSIFFRNGNSREFTVWGKDSTGDSILNQYQFPFLDHPILNAVLRDFERQVPYREILLEGEEIKSYGDLIFSETVFKDASQEYKDSFYSLQKLYAGQAMFKNGFLEAVGTEPLPGDFPEVLKRFAQVIDLAYTRFLDLQKVEAQAREAQIEAALERVRARTMAMHRSDELAEASILLEEEIRKLGIENWGCAFHIYDEETTNGKPWDLEWFTSSAGFLPFYKTPRENIFLKYYEESKKGNPLYVQEFGPEVIKQHYDYLKTLPVLGESLTDLHQSGVPLPDRQIDHVAFFKHGHLLFITYKPVPEAHDIFIRFAKVFDQTYTRFLDLKKAEKQAREAQIEASLERIRARTMAMQSSEELFPTSSFILKELRSLGQDDVEGLFGVSLVYEEKGQLISYISDSGGPVMRDQMVLPLEHHPLIRELYQTWKKARESKPAPQFLSRTLPQKPFREWINQLISYKNGEHPDAFIPVDVIDLSKNYFNLPQFTFEDAFFKQGILWYQSVNPISDEFRDILVRFAKVFEQTYTRFLDLQTAEAQAREGEIQLALERVRARTMAMRDSKELAEVVSELFQQMEPLGFAKFGCALLLIDEENEKAIYWLTTHTNSILPEPYSLRYSDHKISQRIFENYKNQEKKFTLELRDEEKREYDNWMFSNTELGGLPENIKEEVLSKNYVMFSFASMKYGLLYAMDHEPISEELQSIVVRFAKVFEQTYTRFLDLQKAEERARESEIEAGLERVRARSMAMYKSNELLELSVMLFQELDKLGVRGFFNCGFVEVDEEGQKQSGWTTMTDGSLGEGYFLPLHGDSVLDARYRAWKKGEPAFCQKVSGLELEAHLAFTLPTLESARVQEMASTFPDPTYFYCFNFSQGYLSIISGETLDPEAESILLRFTRAFEQAYIRFMDLKKAEAQAKEAEIEASLERIRARTMAMQSSEELLPTSTFILKELRSLGEGDDQGLLGVSLIDEEKNQFISYISDSGGPVMREQMALPLDHHPFIQELHQAWKKAKESKSAPQFLSRTLLKDKFDEWVNQLVAYNKGGHPDAFVPDAVLELTQLNLPQWTFEDAFYKQGILFYQNINPISDEFRDILVRFAKVFEQTYTRFLDLQKAEAQAREARINLAVERVRSHAMAMQTTSDLLDVVVTLRTEFINLGHEAQYFWHMLWKPDKYEKAMTSGDGTRIGFVMELPRSIHAEIPLIDEWEKGTSPTVIYPMDVDAAIDYVHKMVSLGDFKRIDPQAPTDEDIRHIGGLTFIMARTTHGEIGYSLPGPVTDPPQEALDILVRFAGAFDLAHRRFLDLQLSEAQARETQIELSLERIRGQVTSMQESSDLFDIVVAMRKEFVSLGYQADYFWHMRWTAEQYEMSMTSEEGDRIGMVINVPKFVHDAIPSLAKWEKSKKPAFVLALDGEEAWDYIDKMNTYGHYEQADPHAPSKEDILQLGGLTFIIARTSHGEIGFSIAGKVPEPPQESIDTLIRFAGVFDLAYKRFEDLKKAEKDLVEIREAKQKAEEALSDLKAAQAQLIQSEKMASLGELTAGIAHEIQNPLNFVNNFSELSAELLDELKEELEAGDVEEVEAILSDLKDNLTKINHHGKRAGSIVKGMLEHSRKSDGKKESVDINALADECLKLGFHGMRAKDKSFSADFKADLHPDLPAVSIINQDIGRVLLNLVNNAFYAVHDYRKSNEVSDYKPMVKLETGLGENFIEIKISDNAKGIPGHILDKIFQPFFTTKPTGEGTGLGLSLSYDIIKAHGGELTAQNLAEGGAQFKITLPIV